MLNLPKDPRGYTIQELRQICKERKIPFYKFDNAFGVNTAIMAEDGTPRYYRCDVERALWRLKDKDGRYHDWD